MTDERAPIKPEPNGCPCCKTEYDALPLYLSYHKLDFENKQDLQWGLVHCLTFARHFYAKLRWMDEMAHGMLKEHVEETAKLQEAHDHKVERIELKYKQEVNYWKGEWKKASDNNPDFWPDEHPDVYRVPKLVHKKTKIPIKVPRKTTRKSSAKTTFRAHQMNAEGWYVPANDIKFAEI